MESECWRSSIFKLRVHCRERKHAPRKQSNKDWKEMIQRHRSRMLQIEVPINNHSPLRESTFHSDQAIKSREDIQSDASPTFETIHSRMSINRLLN